MHRILLLASLLAGLAVIDMIEAAEVIFTPAELAALKGEPGLDGTRITELGGICYFDIGGEEFQIPCTRSEDVVEPPEPEVPADPEPPTDGGSHVNPNGRVTLVWTPPTEYTDGKPIEPGAIAKYRVNSRGANEDWTFSGDTTTTVLRMTESGCYRVRAIVEGRPWSGFSHEVCLK